MNKFLAVAYKEALKCKTSNDVPVGCVIVKNNKIIAKAHNKREKRHTVLGHAELIALDKASKRVRDWQLVDCDIYITLEPCLMCASAILQSHIKNIYIGAKNVKSGAFSFYKLDNCENIFYLNEDNCENILKLFFKELRNK